MRFDKYVVIVTGAAGRGGGGSGAEIAKEFGRRGASVVVLDIDDAGANETVEAIKNEGGEAHYIHTDMGDIQQIYDAVEWVKTNYGQVDVLVNNAFYLNSEGMLLDVTPEVWDKHFAINVTGAMVLTQSVLPMMLPQDNPSIINISSTSILSGEDGNIAYACSKSALATLTKYIATQYGNEGLRVNTVIPGLILNEATRNYAKQNQELGAYFDVLRSNILGSHTGEASDVANAVLFLASEKSRYINGAELRVDGGFKTHTVEWATLRNMK